MAVLLGVGNGMVGGEERLVLLPTLLLLLTVVAGRYSPRRELVIVVVVGWEPRGTMAGPADVLYSVSPATESELAIAAVASKQAGTVA